MALYENGVKTTFNKTEGEGFIEITDQTGNETKIWFLLNLSGNGTLFLKEEHVDNGPVFMQTIGGLPAIEEWGRLAFLDKIIDKQKNQ